MAQCSTCDGTGEVCYTCNTCQGTGEIIGYDADGNEQLITCSRCKGSGELCSICPTCKGIGEVQNTVLVMGCRGE